MCLLKLSGMPVVVGGGTMVDGMLRRRGDQPDAGVKRRCRQERSVGLHVVVTLGFHWNLRESVVIAGMV